MKNLKLAETSKNDKTNGVIFPAREARREFFFECTFCRAARQVQVRSAPTTKKTIRLGSSRRTI